MGFKKGNSHGNGRPPGVSNKVTTALRQELTDILSSNVGNIQTKLDEIAGDNPVKYIELLLKLADFSLPKLSATHTISQDEDTHVYTVSFSE